MEWQEYIHSDPAVQAGKPLILGTRLSVEFLLDLLAEGWSQQRILDNYPQLSKEALRALFAFAAACMKEEFAYPLDGRMAL